MSTITVVVQKASAGAPAPGSPIVRTQVQIVDQSGAALAPIFLNGTESPPWTAVATGASGSGLAGAVVTDQDASGATVGTPITVAQTASGTSLPASIGATIAVAT